MTNYSSSKTAWPTENLFIGGGPSRPFNKIKITTTKKSKLIHYGRPTKQRAYKMLRKRGY